MRTILCVTLLIFFWVDPAGAETIARFGVIADIHHSNRVDTKSRRFSAALAKTDFFVSTMTRLKADFIIELGDFIEKVVNDKDPIQNLEEIEGVYTSFNGPCYHVLGNHEFDDIQRSELLSRLNNTGVSANKTYYSFNQNGIHCIVLDADYTVAEPHRPFDAQTEDDAFWYWKEAWIPQKELDWLAADLADSQLPTVVFTHQLLHRNNMEDHTVKNAHVVREILEADGQVIAVFSGHDHRGEVSIVHDIHYFVLKGNVGMSLDWSMVSSSNGLDASKDCPFTFVEISELKELGFNGVRTYQIRLKGNGQHYSYVDRVQVVIP